MEWKQNKYIAFAPLFPYYVFTTNSTLGIRLLQVDPDFKEHTLIVLLMFQ